MSGATADRAFWEWMDAYVDEPHNSQYEVPDMQRAFEAGQAAIAAQQPGDLEARVRAALAKSIDECARCKTCDKQVNAVMAAVAAQQPPPAPGLAATQALVRFAGNGQWLTCTDDGRLDLRAELLAVKDAVREALDAAGSPAHPAPGPAAAMAETRQLRARFAGIADALTSEASSDDDAREHKADGISRLLLQQHADLRRNIAARIRSALEGK